MVGYWTIKELSEFLGIKVKTLYAMVSARRIPCYKFGGRLIRFDRQEIGVWTKNQRRDCLNINQKASDILQKIENRKIDIDGIIKKSIEEVNREG